MFIRFLLRALITLSGLVFACQAWANGVIELRTAAQLSPPKYYTLPNGLIGGIGIDVLRAIEKNRPHAPVYRRPDLRSFRPHPGARRFRRTRFFRRHRA